MAGFFLLESDRSAGFLLLPTFEGGDFLLKSVETEGCLVQIPHTLAPLFSVCFEGRHSRIPTNGKPGYHRFSSPQQAPPEAMPLG